MDHQNVLAAQTRPVRGAPGVGMNGTVAGETEYCVYTCMYNVMYTIVCDGRFIIINYA